MEELLLGKWEIQQGFRNGKRANSFDGMFFEFKDNNKMVSNMFGADLTSDYTIEDNTIKQTGEKNVEYVIDNISDNNLTLSTTVQGFDFKLMLVQE